ncbi:polysaccharide biosynthesis tyrosine autokinase [Bifidobacterium simiarum]|uniref:AAA domain-containing protein n=1 Tax=Bifidobacterium simiarum TaxID=2045441 RepID=A0A2M9HEG5_9BIFI|nr:polysaccharide biosynthesis tyrosine autokinase [Bifidobacterium simiarum]PJM75195.1 hypothetical protein CSQ87_06290 [Bifidobacterium simiarum]
MSFQDMLSALRSHWRAELLVIVLIVASMAGWLTLQPRTYTAAARTYVSFSADAGSGTDAGTDAKASGKTALGTQAGTDSSMQYQPTDYVSQQLQLIPALVTTPAVLDDVAKTMNVPSEDLRDDVSAYVSDSYFIMIEAKGADPQRAAAIANAVSDSLSDQLASRTRNTANLYIPSHLRLSVVERAEAPQRPTSPNVKARMAIGVVAALACAFFVGILLELTDNKVRGAAQIQRMLGIPILGTVPKSSVISSRCPSIVNAPASMESEAIRRLALNLTFVTPDRDELSNVFVVASCGASEGKTSLSIELAAAFAEQGRKVLLVGTDMRHPTIARRLGVEEQVGLSHLLTGQVDMATAVSRYWKPNLHVLPAGKRVANPSLIINSKSMSDFLHLVSKEYDWVILDTEPLRVANDALVFAKAGAKMVFVVAQGLATRHQLRDVDREMESIGIEPVGAVLNLDRVSKSETRAYGSYYHDAGRSHSAERPDGKVPAAGGDLR